LSNSLVFTLKSIFGGLGTPQLTVTLNTVGTHVIYSYGKAIVVD